MTEDLLSSLVMHIHGSYKIKFHPKGREDKEEIEIDFTPPFKRIPMISTLEEILKIKFPKDLESEETR